jgi:hypothetical protein
MKRTPLTYALVKTLSLIVAILSVVLYSEIDFPHRVLLWIPITLGYGIYFQADHLFEDKKIKW